MFGRKTPSSIPAVPARPEAGDSVLDLATAPDLNNITEVPEPTAAQEDGDLVRRRQSVSS